MSELLSVAQAAERAGVPAHLLRIAIAGGRITPAARTGRWKLFDPDQIDDIRRAVAEVEETRL